MYDYELQSHKKSDSVKWIIVFVLVALLCVGMAVSLFNDYKKEKPAEQPQIEFSEGGETAKTDDGYNDIIFKE